jgi:type I restriction enzyme R subunit
LRDLRKKVTFAIYGENDNLDEVTRLVEALFSLLDRAQRI